MKKKKLIRRPTFQFLGKRAVFDADAMDFGFPTDALEFDHDATTVEVAFVTGDDSLDSQEEGLLETSVADGEVVNEHFESLLEPHDGFELMVMSSVKLATEEIGDSDVVDDSEFVVTTLEVGEFEGVVDRLQEFGDGSEEMMTFVTLGKDEIVDFDVIADSGLMMERGGFDDSVESTFYLYDGSEAFPVDADLVTTGEVDFQNEEIDLAGGEFPRLEGDFLRFVGEEGLIVSSQAGDGASNLDEPLVIECEMEGLDPTHESSDVLGLIDDAALLLGENEEQAEAFTTFVPFDVNGDSVVTPFDALLVINSLSRLSGTEFFASTAEGEAPSVYDVNRDGRVSATDALEVLSHLFSNWNEDFSSLSQESETESLIAVDLDTNDGAESGQRLAGSMIATEAFADTKLSFGDDSDASIGDGEFDMEIVVTEDEAGVLLEENESDVLLLWSESVDAVIDGLVLDLS